MFLDDELNEQRTEYPRCRMGSSCELTILFSDSNEERFLQAFACTACGDIRLTVDLETDVEG